MAETARSPATALPVREKQARQQLTKGMEHMRSYVTIENTSSPQPEGQDAYGVPASYEPVRKAPTAPEESNPQKRSDPFQFGTRYLEEGDDIFSHNAWDHVEVDPQYNDFIEQQTIFQRENQVSDFDKSRFNDKPEKWWDRFYSNNQANFFKDRKWLVQEFPVLGDVTKAEYGPVTVLEVGAGAGNTAFPVLAMNQNPRLKLHACDYSSKAVDIIRAQAAYTSQASPPILQTDVWDVAGSSLPPGIQPGTVDLVLMIFIFSALSPNQWTRAVSNIFRLLKPGGEVLFRDYGRGDLAQVRFKKGRYLQENFYVRGDGTRVYFFEEGELRSIWEGESALGTDAVGSERGDRDEQQGLSGKRSASATDGVDAKRGGGVEARRVSGEESTSGSDGMAEKRARGDAGQDHREEGERAGFEIANLAVDRRMLVNRQRKLKMYRCWMQGRFVKPSRVTTNLSEADDKT